jgi:predicted dithiol-disulfide oxidoreductase (DUF899 family)
MADGNTPKPKSSHRFPNESDRRARDRLLEAETALRRQIEAVAAQRRALPPGARFRTIISSRRAKTRARSACRSCSRASRR